MTIEQEIKAAKQFFSQHQGVFKQEAPIVEKIEKYRAAILSTYLQMEKLGVLGACAVCASRKSAGCCFKGVEEWYDAAPLIINICMGVEFPRSREFQDACLFVGSQGCKLTARHSFCVNYLCPELLASLTETERKTLSAISGEEIMLGWEVEKSIRDVLMDLR